MLKKSIPNIITLSRAVFSVVFIALICRAIKSSVANAYLIICFCYIILSDIIDGRFARKMNAESATGAKLDVAADLIYVLGFTVVFAYFNKVPKWFPVVLICNFAIFIITSKSLAARSESLRFRLVFDKLGKFAANFTMALPGIFVFRRVIPDCATIMQICVFIITAMFLVSSIYRITAALKSDSG
jgi:phosphatidylglycerophosphate synthase